MTDYEDYGDEYSDEGGDYGDEYEDGEEGSADEDDDYSDEDGYEDEYEDEYEGESKVQIGFKDLERLGGGVVVPWATDAEGNPLKTQTPFGRFTLKVDAIARNIDSECTTIGLSNNDIQTLLDTSEKLKHVEHKNPSGYILGYLATQGGRKQISRDSLKSVWTCYQKLRRKDGTVKEPDIIRYSTLWRGLIKN